MQPPETIRPNGLAALRQLRAASKTATKQASGERCEFCALVLPEYHPHLVELAARRIVCACDACALLFENTAQSKFRRIHRRIRRLVDFQLSEMQWNDLMIPINMAFFFHNTPADRVVAMYPSPAGAVESLLPLESWTSMVAENPPLASMEADVEGLLINRLAPRCGFSEAEYYLAPIDECYKLVGLLRMSWRGLSGGTGVWQRIAEYFADLRSRATDVKQGIRKCPS